MARRSKLTEETQNKIVERIKAGSYAAQAAISSGISERTFYNWLSDGRAAEAKIEEGYRLKAEERKKMQFMQAIKSAESQAELLAVAQIRKAGQDGSWQAAAWYLERKFPARWSRKDKHEIELSNKEEATPSKSREELLQELQRLESNGD